MGTGNAARRHRRKGTLARVVAEFLSSPADVNALLHHPSVSKVFGNTLADELVRDPTFLEGLEDLVRQRLSRPALELIAEDQPSAAESPPEPIRRGNCLSTRGIIEAIEDGRIAVETQCPIWSPKGRPTMVWNGLHFDVDTMELHLGPIIHVPHRPSIRQQILQFLVLCLGYESLRPRLKKYAIKSSQDHEHEDVVDRCREVALTDDNPSYLLLPGEFVHTHSAESIYLAVIREEQFGNKPLLTAQVAGVSFWDRRGKTNNLGSNLIKPSHHQRTHTDEAKNVGPWPLLLQRGGPTGQVRFYELDRDPSPVNGYYTAQHNGRKGHYRSVDTTARIHIPRAEDNGSA